MKGYLQEERETHLYFDGITWKAWTNMPFMAERFRKRGWMQTEVGRLDGVEADWTFTIDNPKAITIRDMTKRHCVCNPSKTRTFDTHHDAMGKFPCEDA